MLRLEQILLKLSLSSPGVLELPSSTTGELVTVSVDGTDGGEAILVVVVLGEELLLGEVLLLEEVVEGVFLLVLVFF